MTSEDFLYCCVSNQILLWYCFKVNKDGPGPYTARTSEHAWKGKQNKALYRHMALHIYKFDCSVSFPGIPEALSWADYSVVFAAFLGCSAELLSPSTFNNQWSNSGPGVRVMQTPEPCALQQLRILPVHKVPQMSMTRQRIANAYPRWRFVL